MGYKQLVSDMSTPNKRYLMDMGAGHRTFRKKYGVSRKEVSDAKKEVRARLHFTSPKKKLPKILVFDIETAPLEAEVWRAWKQNIYVDQINSDWFMLTWAAKWLFSSEIQSGKLTGKEAIAQDDSRLVKDLWNLFDEADMVVAHHGDAFDVPKANTRFLLNGLPPTSSYRQIDTKKIASRQFGFTHNSLNGLAKQFGFDPKLDTDFKLWRDCKAGDEKALAYMEKYNKYDVQLLEDVYLKLRPWIKSHPNVALYIDSDKAVCSNCASENIIETPKFYYTNVSVFKEYTCTECGALTRGRTNVLDKDKRKTLLQSVNR